MTTELKYPDVLAPGEKRTIAPTSTWVYNLETGEEQWYTCDAETAVRSAYAHANNLATQWAVTQGKLELAVVDGERIVCCGDFCAIKARN